jgi:diguanylate cyclase (GGDEF)-like protein/putative nucleotidyltransferase with HDIG domain
MTRKTFRHLPRATQLYIAVIVAAGAAMVCQSTLDLATGDIGWNWTILALLTLLSGSATVSLPSMPATVSVSETFVFTSVILFGSSAGTVTVALDAAIISFWSYRKGQPAYKILFNVCALPLTIWLASHLFFYLTQLNAGRSSAGLPLFHNDDPATIGELLGPLFVFTVVYFGLNSWIITFAIALERQLSPFAIWRGNFAKLSLNYFGGASVAALFVTYTKDLDYTYLLIIVPLIVVLYFTFSTSMGRVEDANRHLTELNTLYMSTIETLAMAIDAKDQITHGHIRRVQRFAVGLASRLGVKDPSLIRAIEAAALLHDMGKLAVPEYILNKPGPLTPAEFEKMKLHASVGADILSSINFPYPVVPIVRHHHENWDGKGYPDGLKATDIPIGARILSVVDCFDALTSDRPYRPRLSDNEAIRILLERRGTMYDPLVVDTFVREHLALSADLAPDAAGTKEGLSAITRATSTLKTAQASRTGLDDINASTGEMLVLYDIASELSAKISFGQAGDVIAKHLRRLVPASTCVFYMYASDSDELIVEHASGEGSAHFKGVRIPRGQRLTGWVAANKQTIVNSDPVLDLGEAARSMKPRLQSCLSTPLIVGQQLVGVLTAYSTNRDAFSDEHRRVIEVIARQVAHPIKQCIDAERSPLANQRDNPRSAQASRIDRLVAAEIESSTTDASLSIIAVEVDSVRSGEPFLSASAAAIKQTLRGADVLFRYEANQFVVLLPQTGLQMAEAIAERIGEKLSALRVEYSIDASALKLGIATAPTDGSTLDHLIVAARFRTKSKDRDQNERPSSIH